MAKKKKRQPSFPQGRVTIDYETTGLSPFEGHRPFIAGMEDEAGNVILARPGERKWQQVKDVLADPKIEKSAHNAKFERLMTSAMGWKVRGNLDCTMLMAATVDEYQKLSLDALTDRHFKRSHKDMIKDWLAKNTYKFRKEIGRDPNYSDAPADLLEKYLELDLDEQVRLDWLFRPVMEKTQKDIYQVERDLLPIVVQMEERGMKIDIDHCHKASKRIQIKMDSMYEEMSNIAGVEFNPGSNIQVGDILLGLGLDTGQRNKPRKGQNPNDTDMKVDKDLLHFLDHPFANTLVQWRAYKRTIGTYLTPFTQVAVGDVVHPSFWQLGEDEGIKTGRFSVKNPALQTLPRGDSKEMQTDDAAAVRQAIVPREGMALVFADYRQIEAILFFIYADDAKMLEFIRAGEDVYRAAARILFGRQFTNASPKMQKVLRQQAKTITLGLMYGMGGAKMGAKMGKSRVEALKLKKQMFLAMPSMKTLMVNSQNDLIRNGYVEDFFGKRYHVPTERAYKAVNAECQGGAAGIMKRAVIRTANALDTIRDTGLVNLVHDEAIAETPISKVKETAHAMKEMMEVLNTFKVPLKVDLSWTITNWADKKPLEV